MAEVVTYLPIVAVVGAGVAFLATLWFSLLTLRAKARFRAALRERMLMELEAQVLKRRLSGDDGKHVLADIEAARAMIEQIAHESLSKQDTELLEKGLRQPSKSGEKRYIRDLLTAH